MLTKAFGLFRLLVSNNDFFVSLIKVLGKHTCWSSCLNLSQSYCLRACLVFGGEPLRTCDPDQSLLTIQNQDTTVSATTCIPVPCPLDCLGNKSVTGSRRRLRHCSKATTGISKPTLVVRKMCVGALSVQRIQQGDMKLIWEEITDRQ